MRKIYFFLVLLCAGKVGMGQTNPVAQSLPYSQDFASLNTPTVTTYPAGWQAWSVTASAPTATGSTNTPTGDKTITANGSAASTGNGAYNFTGKLGFLSTGSVDNAIALAITTTGLSTIRIAFDAMTIRNPYDGGTNNILEALVLQYRVGTSGVFTNLSYSPSEYQQNTTAQTTGTTGQQIVTGLNAVLPAACNNQAVVQIRWIARTISGSAGSRASFALDNIFVTNEPTTQASAINFTSVADNSFTVNWTNGNGTRRAVFMKETAGAITNPSDGLKYTASTDWSVKGTQLGTSGYYCIYDGTGTSVSVTNLLSGTVYYCTGI